MAKMRRHQASGEKTGPDETAGCVEEAGNDRTAVNDYSRSFNIDDSQQQLDPPSRSKKKESKRGKVDDEIGFENENGPRDRIMQLAANVRNEREREAAGYG